MQPRFPSGLAALRTLADATIDLDDKVLLLQTGDLFITNLFAYRRSSSGSAWLEVKASTSEAEMNVIRRRIEFDRTLKNRRIAVEIPVPAHAQKRNQGWPERSFRHRRKT